MLIQQTTECQQIVLLPKKCADFMRLPFSVPQLIKIVIRSCNVDVIQLFLQMHQF